MYVRQQKTSLVGILPSKPVLTWELDRDHGLLDIGPVIGMFYIRRHVPRLR